MKRVSNVRNAAGTAAMLAAATFAAPASADVLEVSEGNHSWIAGGPIGPADTARDGEVKSDLMPGEVVADISVSGSAIPPRYAAKVAELSARFDLSPALIEALVWQESRWREGARSPVGARGLAQLMPGTARELGVDPDDPLANLEGGARYLREQIDRFDGNLEHALAAYNAGPGRVIRARGVPNITETKTYVAAIMGRLADNYRRQM